MKILIRIAVAVIGLFMLFVISAYAFLLLKGPPFVAGQFEGLTRKKINIGYFGLSPTLKLDFRNVSIENEFKAKRVIIAPNFLLLATGKMGFDEIRLIDPEYTYERYPAPVPAQPQAAGAPESQQPAATAPATIPAPTAVAAPSESAKPKARLPLVFKHINITGGKVNFIDHTVGAEGIRITVSNISCKVNNLSFVPHSAITRFQLRGSIPWHAGEEAGRIFTEGWLDMQKKDMHALLKIEGIDGIYLYPYYSQWVNLQKSSIEKAKLDFSSNINGLNNDVAAACHFELRDIVFRERPAEEQAGKEEKMAKAVLKFLKSLDNGKIVLDFTIRTKMTRPQLGLGLVVGAVENKFNNGIQAKKRPIVGDVFALPVRLLESMVKAGSDLSKAVIDGTVAIGSELKKATQASFTREK